MTGVADRPSGHGTERTPTPEEQLLPTQLVERICHVVRLAGLPLAVDTGDGGVFLEQGSTVSAPADHVVISWHVTNRLFEDSEHHVTRRSADKLLLAAYPAIEDALETILSAAGLAVAKHPRTHSLAVWAAPSDRAGVPARVGRRTG
ncbi:hypothetical protein ACTMTU_31965 [Streptomyces sp. OZ13]|uniref:hypothetical protein n=1 Tax=Streptomyces sp. OZ13 TaxID=3452210 RepID=UPI003F8958D4